MNTSFPDLEYREACQILVLFHRRPNRRISTTRWLKINHRKPMLARRWAVDWLVQFLNRSDLTHCTIACDGAVWDPSLEGDRYYALEPFLLHEPRLEWCISVPVSRPCDLDKYRSGRSRRLAGSILRWATRGLTPADNCVTCAVRVLRDAGVPAPERTVNPAQLRDWLKEQGYGEQRMGSFHD